MTLPLVGLFDGISPLWWFAAGVVFLVIEALTVTTHLLWPALAAFGVALALWLVADLPALGQLGLFAALTIALILVGRPLIDRLRPGDAAAKLNRRTAALIGREAVVDSFHGHEGQVRVDGVVWPARLDGRKTPRIGERVRITAADGIVVWVTRIAREDSAKTVETDSV